jgi:two-component system chemotaxis response regulator CheY
MAKILVVDDAASIRLAVTAVLRWMGHESVDAVDGADALGKLAAENIDLVICDWNMPNVDGEEFLRRLRGDPRTRRMPVVMLTAEAERSRIQRLMQFGVGGYVVKPFRPNTLSAVVREVLNGAAMLRDLD